MKRQHRMSGSANKDIFSNAITHVKGVAILLVVLGHIASPFGIAIFSFHIPLFFFLGGVFIKTTYPATDFLRRNSVRLMVPYLIFGAVGLLVNHLKNILLHRPLEDLTQSVTGLLFWMDVAHLQHYGMVLWFLPALFWARIWSFCLMKYLKLNDFMAFLLCAACAYLFSSLEHIALPFGMDEGMVALPWVFMGTCFYRHKEKALALPVWKVAPAALLVLFIIHLHGLPRLDMAAKDLDHFFVTLPYTFAVIFLVVYLAYGMNSYQHTLLKKIAAPLSVFGAQSMLVYIVHPYTNNGAYLLSTYFLGDGYWYIKFALTTAMLTAAIRIKLKYRDAPLFRYL